MAAMALLMAPGQAGARDAFLWPFDAASPWNRPIGAGARFSGPSDPMTLDLLAGPNAIIHAGTWSMPIFLAAPADPVLSVHDSENHRDFRAHIPPGARPDPMGDGHLFVVDPSRHTALEMYRARRQADGGWLTIRSFVVDLHGPGMFLRDGRFPGVRAMDASGMGGIIRAWEVANHHIGHTLTFLLPPWRLRHGPVWPSGREDFWGFRDYRGHVPIGTLIAIPPDVDVTKLGLTPDGLVLAHALQDYGAYCDDSVGTDGMALSAEAAAEPLPALAAMRHDFPRIRRSLRAVLNNGVNSPGGGGAPRQPPAPPLDP
jgi:hypothetical protein